ncbi:hypothetical protein BG015_000718 [Linnemannia schmuckeri]|uniref:Galactose oxidase n=1 Tax=Linnemannia schmuckeri TaxID=64567 RepID=A0A9P5RSU9_9FUNG|nr:hypothetical protein BG015_000718 [Linnemannia schmuckeri]
MTVSQGDTIASGVVQGSLIAISRTILTVPPFLLFTTLLITLTSAQQPVAPLPAIQFSSIASANNTLYIRGGNIQIQQVAQQFYSLNLTPLLAHSGNITWTKRNAGPLIDFRTILPLAVDNDNQGLISFGDLGTLARYNVATDTWSKEVPICKTPFGANTALLSIASFQPALTDPRTGLIYIPYGYEVGKSMLVFNNASNACSGIPMPEGESNGQLYAWSESRNAIYMLGDTVPSMRITLWQFDLNTRHWNTFNVDPQVQLDACMASAYGGRKLILFGGTTAEGLRHGNTYIFDTTTNTWTTGATSPNPRSEMACATAGDYFVAWGGYENSAGEIYPAEILFYDIKNDKWVNRTDIVPPPVTPTLSVPVASGTSAGSGSANTGLPNTDTSSTSKNTAAVFGGGVAAGVVLITAIIIGFIFLRRRRRNAKAKRDPQDLKLNSLPFPNSSQASLASKGRLDTQNVANAPHAPFDPTINSFPHYKASIQDSPTHDQDSNITMQNQAGDGLIWTQGYHDQSPRPGTGGAGRVETTYPIPPPTPLSPQLYHMPPPHQDQDESEFNQPQTWNSPQHLEPVSPLRSPDYGKLQQEFPSPASSTARNPQGQQSNDMTPINDPLEEIAAVQAKYEQHVERVRQEQQAEMERIRREWEEQMAGRA